MARFEDLQTLWQNQATPTPPVFDAPALSGAFRRLGRRHDVINVIKSLMVAWALYSVLSRPVRNPLMWYGCLGLILTAVVALVVEWRIQRRIGQLNFSDPSIDFVRTSIARLESQRNPYHTLPYFVLLVAGVIVYNAIVVTAYPKLTMPMRLVWHAAANLFLVAVYGAGRWIRYRRWKRFYLPLIERLNDLLGMLEERAQ